MAPPMHELAQQALDRVRVKEEYFVDVRVWPVQAEFDPNGWLRNFCDEDVPYAALLLDSFVYFSSQMADAMFASAVQAISTQFNSSNHANSANSWRIFLESALFCVVTGENPNPSDSGYLFARKARQVLGITEERLVEPDVCLGALIRNGNRPVIFIDDFVGSGNQFAEMWERQYEVGSEILSFFIISKNNPSTPFYYCPVLSTKYGLDTLNRRCPSVKLFPAHILDPLSSPLHPATTVFPPELRAQGQEMIERVSKDIGIPADAWRGFHDLGCAVAFEHCIPDATLPLFYWSQNWRPLMRRT